MATKKKLSAKKGKITKLKDSDMKDATGGYFRMRSDSDDIEKTFKALPPPPPENDFFKKKA